MLMMDIGQSNNVTISMFLMEDTLMNNIINWILEDETQAVKYRAMTELLCMKKDDPKVIKVYNSLLVSDTVNLIMDKFKTNNKWEDINAFCALAEIGLTREDVPIECYSRCAQAYIYTIWRWCSEKHSSEVIRRYLYKIMYIYVVCVINMDKEIKYICRENNLIPVDIDNYKV